SSRLVQGRRQVESCECQRSRRVRERLQPLRASTKRFPSPFTQRNVPEAPNTPDYSVSRPTRIDHLRPGITLEDSSVSESYDIEAFKVGMGVEIANFGDESFRILELRQYESQECFIVL